ncbi:retrovirus-related pol polyprotein from transposon TNT 1-94 [Tanacetum coccineum]
MTITLTTVSSTLGVKYVVVLHMNHLTVLRNTPTPGYQGLPTGNQNPLKSGFTKGTNPYENVSAGLPQEESGPKVVSGDDSLGDTEGYGSVDCNGITFTRVAYPNGLKHNLISIKEEMSMSFICHLSIKKAMLVSLPRPPQMENLNEVRVKELRSDNRTEFRNHKLEDFCDEKGISQNFSSPCTPEQNGVAERRNKTLIEAARTMLNMKMMKQFLNPAQKVMQSTSMKTDPFQMMNSLNQGVKLLSALAILNPPEFTKADNHPALNEPDQIESVDPLKPTEPQNNVSIEPINRWLREKHIELVNIIGEPLVGITTRSRIRDSDAASAFECLYVNFFLEMEPKKLIEALEEEGWNIAMQEELNQFERNKERIDYEETFAPVPRLEAIRIFLAYAAYMGFMVYQMDVKSAFLNGKISEEVLAKKYDLADCASVKCPMLPSNNLGPDESGVSVNETLFRGMIGSLMYLTVSKPDIQFSTCLCARYQANPKESYLVAVKRISRYLKGNPNLGLWYPKGLGFDLKAYSDSDYAGCNLDRKSTSGGCQILGGKLVCWSAKKQSYVEMTLAEAEYVVAAKCCAHVLWIKSQLADYDVLYDKVPLFCDNTSAIAISNNLVLHSRTKYIDIKYHFIRDHILKGDIKPFCTH